MPECNVTAIAAGGFFSLTLASHRSPGARCLLRLAWTNPYPSLVTPRAGLFAPYKQLLSGFELAMFPRRASEALAIRQFYRIRSPYPQILR